MNTKTAALDFSAISLSALCLIHCLALPLLAAGLPVIGVLSQAEWFHQLLVLLALPVTVLAIGGSVQSDLSVGVRVGESVGEATAWSGASALALKVGTGDR
ncbi:MAG: MerC domain-containing protein, partial [Pseudomonadota bacterium]